ncbi:hypothetical protein HY419_00550 [candidate division WWE3 bacterium]|nr:hypothetical protein [candidate division WWE3 bacterium]
MSIYTFADKTLSPVLKVSVASGNSASGFGESDPLVSPNLLYTAVIDDQTHNLWIVSNETKELKQITQTGDVSYLSGWSKDSKKIVYRVDEESITSLTQGYGGYQETKVQFKPNRDAGYFAFDIDSGVTTKLYPLDYFETFIDSKNILTKPIDQYSSDRLVIFDTNTFEADYGFVPEKFGFGAGQFSFSDDGTKWVYTLSRNPTTDANIIYAPFPQKEGETIDSGAWADVQFPNISHNGTKVAYSKKDGPAYAVWVYNTADKSKKKYDVEGWAVAWVDENTIVVKSSNASKSGNSLYSVDLTTGTVTKIY